MLDEEPSSADMFFVESSRRVVVFITLRVSFIMTESMRREITPGHRVLRVNYKRSLNVHLVFLFKAFRKKKTSFVTWLSRLCSRRCCDALEVGVGTDGADDVIPINRIDDG